MRACHPDWLDENWWQREIAAVVCDPDPVRCNLRITAAHDRLSLALRDIVGHDAGANFHTWAVWGSKKAGATIRHDDTRQLRRFVSLTSALVGGSTLALTTRLHGRRARLIGILASATLTAGPVLELRRQLRGTSRHVLGGNRSVLEDIGLPTAGFVAAFHACPEPDPDRLARFLTTLRPGPTATGGQVLLRRAYTHYYRARWASTLDARHEQMLLANYCAILHEHLRLDPYISAAIRRPWRRWVTDRLLSFTVGAEAMHVGRDVSATADGAFPETLQVLVDAELLSFLNGNAGWDRTPDDLLGSSATDWAVIGDRMNYIVDLFRSRHLQTTLFDEPFTADQMQALAAGRVPSGPL